MHEDGSMIVIPTPYVDEMISSWLLRIALLHDVALVDILRALGIKKWRDLDRSCTERAILRFTRGIQIDHNRIQMISCYFKACRSVPWLPGWLRVDEDGKPATAFCPECLSDIPYWRAVWRYRFWVVCPTHQRVMLTTCPECRHEISIPIYTKPVGRGSKSMLLSICECHNCGRLLSLDKPRPEINLNAVHMLIRLQKTVMASILLQRIELKGISRNVPLNFLPTVLLVGATPSTDRDPEPDPITKSELRKAIRRSIKRNSSEVWRSNPAGVKIRKNHGLEPLSSTGLSEYAVRIRFEDIVAELVLDANVLSEKN